MALLLAAGIMGLAALDRVEILNIKPSETDEQITQFDNPHQVFIDKDAKPKDELLLFLPGTNGKPGGVNEFCDVAVREGFQVINLMYPDSIPADVLTHSTDKDAFLNFRLEIIEGKNLSTRVNVDRTNCIENRLVKLIRYLDKSRPNEHWGRYLTLDDGIIWDRIVVSGLSQGAGHAALIAVRHKVARAVLFGGPKDYDLALNAPANWMNTRPATSPSLMYAFNNKQDHQGCDYTQQIMNCQMLGMQRYGPVCDVDTHGPPFEQSHELFTNYPGTPVPSIRAHTSVVGDGSTPKATDGTPLFRPVWLYMLTHRDASRGESG